MMKKINSIMRHPDAHNSTAQSHRGRAIRYKSGRARAHTLRAFHSYPLPAPRITFVLFAASIVIYACTSPKSSPSPDEIQIREARHLSNLAIANHDTVTIANYWTDDFHVVSSRNFELAGREANRQIFVRDFKTKQDVVYVRTPAQVEIFPDWGMASETGMWTGQWLETDGLVKLSGTYYAKWHKIDGTWKIRAEIFTPLACTGSAFCTQNPKLN